MVLFPQILLTKVIFQGLLLQKKDVHWDNKLNYGHWNYCLFGLICASATKDLYGTEMWLPTDIVFEWVHSDYSPELRAASFFFFGFEFAASKLSFNVLANGFA